MPRRYTFTHVIGTFLAFIGVLSARAVGAVSSGSGAEGYPSWQATKNYTFNGQVVARRKNGVLSYLQGDHLGSTVLTTNSSGNVTGNHGYYAYGKDRYGSEVGTENRFTGQKLDGVVKCEVKCARKGIKPYCHLLFPGELAPPATLS